jgi:hypothetical protein
MRSSMMSAMCGSELTVLSGGTLDFEIGLRVETMSRCRPFRTRWMFRFLLWRAMPFVYRCRPFRAFLCDTLKWWKPECVGNELWVLVHRQSIRKVLESTECAVSRNEYVNFIASLKDEADGAFPRRAIPFVITCRLFRASIL